MVIRINYLNYTLKQQKEIPKRHYILIYDNEELHKWLLKSVDKLAKEEEWFRCFTRPMDL